MNGGPLPMSNGLTRLQTRFLGDPRQGRRAADARRPHTTPAEAEEAGLVTFAPDEIDWDDEVRSGGRGARRVFAGRDDRPRGQPALRRSGDDGDEDLRTADGVAELDLPAAERGREKRARSRSTDSRGGRNSIGSAPSLSAPNQHNGHQGHRGESQSFLFSMSLVSFVSFVLNQRGNQDDFRREDSEQRQPVRQQASAARARALAAEVHPVVDGDGPAGIPGLPPGLRAHRDQRRPRRAGRISSTSSCRSTAGASSWPIPCTIAGSASATSSASRSGRRCPANSATSCAG